MLKKIFLQTALLLSISFSGVNSFASEDSENSMKGGDLAIGSFALGILTGFCACRHYNHVYLHHPKTQWEAYTFNSCFMSALVSGGVIVVSSFSGYFLPVVTGILLGLPTGSALRQHCFDFR